MQEIPTFLSTLSPILGIDHKIPIETVIGRIQREVTLDSLIANPVTVRGKRFHEFTCTPSPTIFSQLKRLCKCLTEEWNTATYCQDWRETWKVIYIGLRVYRPQIRSVFINYGLWDQASDLFLPKSGIKSNLPQYPVFGAMRLRLPTTWSAFITQLHMMSETVYNLPIPAPELESRLLSQLLVATTAYPVDFVWDNGAIPEPALARFTDTVQAYPKTNVLALLSPGDRDRLIIKHPEPAAVSIASEPGTLDLASERVFTDRYPNLGPKAIADFLSFLDECQGIFPDPMPSIRGFLSEVGSVTKSGKLIMHLAPNRINLTYLRSDVA
jgi:hypothetical protein